MPRRLATIEIPCPVRPGPDDDPCGQPLRVSMSPYVPGTRLDPPEGPDIEDVDGTCEHVETVDWNDLYDAAVEALAEADGAARDRYYDQKLHMKMEEGD